MKNATCWVLLVSLAAVGASAVVPNGARAQDDQDATGDEVGSDEADPGEASDQADAPGGADTDDAASEPDAAEDADQPAGDDVGSTEEVSDEPEPDRVGDLSAPLTVSAPDAAEEAQEEANAEGEEGNEEEAPAAGELPWRNTFFTWGHQVNFNSFFQDSQLSYNPNYSQFFSLAPRWYVAPQSFFWANIQLSLELTDMDGNSLNREPQISDTLVEFRQLIPWEGFVFIAAGRLGFPTSLASIAAQRYVQTGLALTVIRAIPEATLTIAAQVAYRRWWAGSNVVRVGEPQPDMCPQGPSATAPSDGAAAPEINTVSCDQLGTATAGRDNIVSGLSVTATPVGGLSINLTAFFLNVYGYELAPAFIDVDTSAEPVRIDDGSPTHWRNFTYISLSLSYQFLPWLNVSLGIQNNSVWAPAYNPNGSIRNPIFTPDTQVFLTATMQLDTLWGEITGGGEDNLTPEERQRRRQGLASGPRTGGTF